MRLPVCDCGGSSSPVLVMHLGAARMLGEIMLGSKSPMLLPRARSMMIGKATYATSDVIMPDPARQERPTASGTVSYPHQGGRRARGWAWRVPLSLTGVAFVVPEDLVPGRALLGVGVDDVARQGREEHDEGRHVQKLDDEGTAGEEKRGARTSHSRHPRDIDVRARARQGSHRKKMVTLTTTFHGWRCRECEYATRPTLMAVARTSAATAKRMAWKMLRGRAGRR